MKNLDGMIFSLIQLRSAPESIRAITEIANSSAILRVILEYHFWVISLWISWTDTSCWLGKSGGFLRSILNSGLLETLLRVLSWAFKLILWTWLVRSLRSIFTFWISSERSAMVTSFLEPSPSILLRISLREYCWEFSWILAYFPRATFGRVWVLARCLCY